MIFGSCQILEFRRDAPNRIENEANLRSYASAVYATNGGSGKLHPVVPRAVKTLSSSWLVLMFASFKLLFACVLRHIARECAKRLSFEMWFTRFQGPYFDDYRLRGKEEKTMHERAQRTTSATIERAAHVPQRFRGAAQSAICIASAVTSGVSYFHYESKDDVSRAVTIWP
ncbi:hypothetical protein GCM10027416_12400 [Okibacterium endophyticum]